jgi:hypothetical protein
MIKNFIIYKFSEEFSRAWRVETNLLSQSTLKKCLQNAQGFSKKKMEAFTALVKREKLALEEETLDHYIANFSCEFRTPKLIAAGVSPPFVPVNFKIWLRKKSSWVIPFDAGRKLSGAAVALLSYATTRNPSSIEHIKLEKEDFLSLKNWVLAESYTTPGQIKRITMHDIMENSVKFKQVVLNSPQLEISKLFNRLLNSAQAIANLSFTTPPLKSTSRSLSCRINHWGCVTIYTPDLLDSELSELISIFEMLYVKKSLRRL